MVDGAERQTFRRFFIQEFLQLIPDKCVERLPGEYRCNVMVQPVHVGSRGWQRQAGFPARSPPSDAEVARVADRVHLRVVKLLERRGLAPQADPAEADMLAHDEPLLAELYSASVLGRIATGPRAGKGVVRVGDGEDMGDATMPAGKCCATVAGFGMHAGVCVPARDRMRLDRLARYTG
jgi:hypothetical protein